MVAETSVELTAEEIELLIDGLCALEDLDTAYMPRAIDELKRHLQNALRQI
jgi:hypothetical protein